MYNGYLPETLKSEKDLDLIVLDSYQNKYTYSNEDGGELEAVKECESSDEGAKIYDVLLFIPSFEEYSGMIPKEASSSIKTKGEYIAYVQDIISSPDNASIIMDNEQKPVISMKDVLGLKSLMLYTADLKSNMLKIRLPVSAYPSDSAYPLMIKGLDNKDNSLREIYIGGEVIFSNYVN